MRPSLSRMVVCLLLAAGPLPAETVTVQPGQSLQEAADKLNPGDTLLLAEGTYYQSLNLTRSGTADNPIAIKAKAPGKVIITGAMETTPEFEHVQGAVYTADWGTRGWKGGGTGRAWAMADDRSLYNYKNAKELNSREKVPQEGFLCQGREMYIRLLGGADPNKAKIAMSRPDAAVLLDIQGQQHIVLEGLRFHVAPAAGVRLGPSRASEVCRNIVIRDCYFLGCHVGIAGRGSRKGNEEFEPSDITIEYCQFNNYPTYQWVRHGQLQQNDTWGSLYSSVLGAAGVAPGGRATSWKVRHCYFHDCFDGIESATTVSKDPALLNEYSYNLLQNCADDSIEFDTMEYAGVRVHHNVFLDGFCMLGLSPVQAGGVTIENNIVYVSPEYGMPWGVIFKFSTPSGSAWWRGGFHPLTGMTIRNNTFVHTKCGVSWGADPKNNPYFKDNTVAGNIIYALDWKSWGGLPCKLGLTVEKNNLCCGPSVVAGKDVPEGIPCTRNTEPFVRRDTSRWQAMPPLLPALAAEGEMGEDKEINRVNFAVGEEYVRAAVKESGLPEADYKDLYKTLGAVPPGTKWEFPRPGPRWSVGELALFRPPLPPSLDPWWVGFADQPSDVKAVKIRPWRGKFYKKFQNSGEGSDPK